MDFSTLLVQECDQSLFRLFDAMIVSRMIFWLYFLMSALASSLKILHISACSIRCLLLPFPPVSRRFVIRVRVGDDNLDFCGLVIALLFLTRFVGSCL